MTEQLRNLWTLYPEWSLALARLGSYILLYLIMLVLAAIVKSFRSHAKPPPFLDELVNGTTLVMLFLLTVGTIAGLTWMYRNPVYLITPSHWAVYGVIITLDVVLLAFITSAYRSTRVPSG